MKQLEMYRVNLPNGEKHIIIDDRADYIRMLYQLVTQIARNQKQFPYITIEKVKEEEPSQLELNLRDIRKRGLQGSF